VRRRAWRRARLSAAALRATVGLDRSRPFGACQPPRRPEHVL